MAGLAAMLWKEWRELLSFSGGRNKAGLLVFIGILGVVLPWQMGRRWVESPLVLADWAWGPLYAERRRENVARRRSPIKVHDGFLKLPVFNAIRRWHLGGALYLIADGIAFDEFRRLVTAWIGK